MTDIRKLLAANIKAFRSELGLTQPKLAERANTSTHHIAMIEVCKNFPSPEMIGRIAKALEKDTVDLFAMPHIHKEQNIWKEAILADIEKLINNRLDELRKAPDQPNC
ncbi:MAG: helix-turn-helix transcriptional regulator [Treponema sp.]|nr:helix-turn-helix transcriptional regulator [Treponema sp.]